MRYITSYIPVIFILIIFLVTGCHKAMVKASHPEDIPDLLQNDDRSLSQEDRVQQDESCFVSQPPLIGYPVSLEQLQSSIREMEAFRLFSYYVLLQKDMKTCAELKDAALEYIERYINPLLIEYSRENDLQNTEPLATLLYLKAYLLLIYEENLTFRKTLKEFKRRFPDQIQNLTTFHFDTGSTTIVDGFSRSIKEQLEMLINDEK